MVFKPDTPQLAAGSGFIRRKPNPDEPEPNKGLFYNVLAKYIR
jgi:hypothetical protein